MKDSFILEGKKWISARRASKVSDYASDYIGQLCRADKLECRMIGRTWFVTEESIYAHKANIVHDKIYRNKIQSLKSEKELAADLMASPDLTAVRQVKSEVVSEKSETSNSQIHPSTISYSSDPRPLLPQIEKVRVVQPEKIEIKQIREDVGVQSANKQIVSRVLVQDTVSKKTSAEVLPVGSMILQRAMNMMAVLVLVVGVIGGAMFAFNQVSGVLSAKNQNEASIGSAIGSVFDFLQEGYASVLAFLGGEKKPATLAVHTEAEIEAGTSAGIAVVQSTGSDSADEEVKKKIINSFSDEVDVRPDESGTAGVITPVFRETKGKDFIYVMVPVDSSKETEKKSSL